MYTKAFLLHLINVWERTSKKIRRDGETREHKLNEMGALKMKQKKWNKLDRNKRSSYSPAVFKHHGWLDTYLQHITTYQDNSDMYLDFKKWLQVFLLDLGFGDTEFYYFSVD